MEVQKELEVIADEMRKLRAEWEKADKFYADQTKTLSTKYSLLITRQLAVLSYVESQYIPPAVAQTIRELFVIEPKMKREET